MTSGPSRGDVLSAASLLLAILAVLYSLWYAEIAAALEVTVPRHLEDAGQQRRQIKGALNARALPLAVATLLLTLVFLPEGVHIAIHWARHVSRAGLSRSVRDYDPVSLALVLVVLSIGALGIYTITLATKLWHLKARLTP